MLVLLSHTKIKYGAIHFKLSSYDYNIILIIEEKQPVDITCPLAMSSGYLME